MQIKLLRRDQISDTQWNARVAESGDSLPYALTSYLDIVTDRNWSALVGDDYKAIFPLPYEYKLGLQMYLQPPLTQQLGLIAHNYTKELELTFLDAIPNKVASVQLKGNERSQVNQHDTFDVITRTNLILPLEKSYKDLITNYSKSLRKRVRKSKEIYSLGMSTDVASLISYYRKEMSDRVGLNTGQYSVTQKLIEHLLENELGTIYTAKRDEQVEGALFVIKYQNRIINLFGTSNTEGKKNHAMHFILNHIIESNSESDKLLDFEGSDLKGVKEFYQSFGPEQRSYLQYERANMPMWFKLLRGLRNLRK